MERLMFPYYTYTNPPQSLFPKKMNSGFIYTMNANEENMKDQGYNVQFDTYKYILKIIFGESESLFSFDTYQFKDYSKVVADHFDAEHKAKRHEEVFYR
jgi:hypothetical protein